MNPPKLDVNGGVYDLVWEDALIRIRMNRIQEHSGVLSGEILVLEHQLGPTKHLHGPVRFNLMSSPARAGLAKTLTARLNHLDWVAVIEQACVAVIRRYRQGEPFIDLATLEPGEQSTLILEPILRHNEPTIIYGDGGAGKSRLALYFASLISSGIQSAGLIPEPANVGYLDFETDRYEMRERLQEIASGLGVTLPSIFYRRCYQALPDMIEDLQADEMDHGIGYWIIDSAGPACGGEPEKAEMALRYFNALRQLQGGSLTIAHNAKNATDKTVFGSVFWTNMARSVFELKKSQEVGADEIEVGLYHKKSNNRKLLSPIGFLLKNTSLGLVIQQTAVRNNPDLAAHMPVKDRIIGLLASGAKTTDELAEVIGEDKQDTIRMTLNRYKGKLFVQVNGKWGRLISAYQ